MISTALIISVVIHLALSYPTTKPINNRRVHPREVGKINLNNGNMYPISESMLNIDQMVKEVQDLIRSNSSFPRLTRGEIIDLIEDISRTELNTLAKQRDHKSVMLVMPYTANNVGPKQIEELYTKPPITKIVNDNVQFSNYDVDALYKRRRRPAVKAPESVFGLDGTPYQYNPVEQNYVKRAPIRQDEAALQSYYPNYLEQNVEPSPPYPNVKRVKVPVPRVVPDPTRQTFAHNPNYVAVQRVKQGFAGAEGLVDPTRESLGTNSNYVTVKRVKTGLRRVPIEPGISNLDYSSLTRRGIPVVEPNEDIYGVRPNYVTVQRVKGPVNQRVPANTFGFTPDHSNSADGQQNYVIKRIKVPARKPELQPYQSFETHPYYSDKSHQNFYNGIDLDSASSMKVEQFSPEKPPNPSMETPQRSPEEIKNRTVIPVEEEDFDSVHSPKVRQKIRTVSHYEKNRNGNVKPEQPTIKKNQQEEKIEHEKEVTTTTVSTTSATTTTAATTTTVKNPEVSTKFSARLRQRIRVYKQRSTTPSPFSKNESNHVSPKRETESFQVDHENIEDGNKPSPALEHKKNETKTVNEGGISKGKTNDVNWDALLHKFEKNKINANNVKVTIPEKVFFVNPVKVEVSTTEKPEIITFKSFMEEFQTPKAVRRLPLNRPALPTENSVITKSEPQPKVLSTTSKPEIVEELSTTKPVRRPAFIPTPSTEISVVTRSETQTNIVKRRRRPTLSPSVSPIPTTTKHQNHKYSGENFSNMDNNGLKIIPSPNLNTEPYKSQTTMETYKEKKFSPAVSSARPFEIVQVTPASLLSNINLPEHLKHTLQLLSMEDFLNKIPNETNKETPSPEFQTLPPMSDDFKNMIDSYVIYSPPATTTTTTTTTTSMPDLSNVADNLGPDMKELLMSFGILPDANPVEEPVTVEQTVPGLDIAETDPDSYFKFKPLPKGGTIINDMEEFLGRFGLGRDLKNNRDQKSLSNVKEPKLNKIPSVDLSGIPDSLKDTIKDLGLIDENKQITEENIKTVIGKNQKEDHKEKAKQTFKPAPASKDELKKLENLLGIIKQLDRLNRTIGTNEQTEEDVKSLTKLVGNFNSQVIPLNEQNWAPNPLSEDDVGLTKNEVKRQQNSSTEATVLVTAITESSNIKGLEDSFGGSDEVAQIVTIPPPISSTPNTGFYYLVDWNSFLDIDDQKGKRVNLRIQPKVGDPNKFLSVTVP